MLSSRYLHLHEALGLGPMWLKQGAAVLPPQSAGPSPQAQPETPAAPAHPQPATQAPPRTQPAPDATVSGARAATLASLGLKTRPPEAAETDDASARTADPIADTGLPHDPDNTVARHKARLSAHIRPAKLLVVSICPSTEDQIAGRLFSGKVGELLDNMLAAIGLAESDSRKTSWLGGPASSDPDDAELAHALPRIRAELELSDPRAVLFLGQHFTAPGRAALMAELTGGLPAFTVPHPARLLRHPEQKAAAWAELKKLRSALR